MCSLKGAFMTQLLIRLFIRRPNSPQDPRVRAAYGNLASVVGMVCNILLCLGKFVVGTLFGSIAITADALNNLSDASSNIVSLVGFKLAAKAPDAEHPYGHARFEYLAGLVVSVTILGIGFSLLKESVTKVLHPTPVQFGWLTVAVLVVSILVKLWMSGFNRTIGRTIGSETLMATAADSRNDVLTTSAVLLSTVLSRLTGWDVLDGLMGVAVARSCTSAFLHFGVKAMEQIRNHVDGYELQQVTLGIVITAGMVSNLTVETVKNEYFYNDSIAHGFYYGCTVCPGAHKHLHGELVSMGILVLLTLDKQFETRDRLFPFYKALGLPMTMEAIELPESDLPTLVDKAATMDNWHYVPTPITKEQFTQAILDTDKAAKAWLTANK